MDILAGQKELQKQLAEANKEIEKIKIEGDLKIKQIELDKDRRISHLEEEVADMRRAWNGRFQIMPEHAITMMNTDDFQPTL